MKNGLTKTKHYNYLQFCGTKHSFVLWSFTTVTKHVYFDKRVLIFALQEDNVHKNDSWKSSKKLEVCPSVKRLQSIEVCALVTTSEWYKNGWTIEAGFCQEGFLQPILCCVLRNQNIFENTEIFFQTLDSWLQPGIPKHGVIYSRHTPRWGKCKVYGYSSSQSYLPHCYGNSHAI